MSKRKGKQREHKSVSEREAPAIITPKPAGKGLLRAFPSLRQRNFRLYWFGQMISLIGSRMQTIGQAWLVLSLTHSAWQLGLVGALQFLPVLLFSILGGVFADRWPKRPVLLLTESAAMLQALLLAGQPLPLCHCCIMHTRESFLILNHAHERIFLPFRAFCNSLLNLVVPDAFMLPHAHQDKHG